MLRQTILGPSHNDILAEVKIKNIENQELSRLQIKNNKKLKSIKLQATFSGKTAGEAAPKIRKRIAGVIGIHIEPAIVGIPVSVNETNNAAGILDC